MLNSFCENTLFPGFGHPGLPNGLFRLASSMTPTCKSPTKATAKEPKASLVKRPLLEQEQGDNSLKSPDRVARNLNYGDPPVLSPQVRKQTNNQIIKLINNQIC